MKKLFTLIGLNLIFGMYGYSQQSNTIYQTLGTNLTTKPFVTTPVRSIGQINHLLIATFGDATGFTCVSPTATQNNVGMTLEGSFDNISFFQIPQKSQTIAGSIASTRFITYVFGSGSFPYVRANVTEYDNVNCKISILAYSGNITPDNDFFPGISKLGMTYASLSQPSSAVRSMVLCPSAEGLRSSLYGAEISTDTAQIIRLATYDPGTVTATIIYQFHLAANSSIILPIGDNTYGVSVYAGSILIDANGTTGTISASGQCRLE